MTISSASTKKSVRAHREDGEATRAKIIETAGRLFAEKGFPETTSKEISDVSGTNITGINYHFGSREGLYEAVVREVTEYMLDPEFLNTFEGDALTPREKMEAFIDSKARFGSDDWQLRLWAREVVAPSTIWLKVADQERVLSRIDVVGRVLSAYTGIPVGDPELELCLLSLMSPVMSLLMISPKLHKRHIPMFHLDPAMVTRVLKTFLLAGIDKIAEDYRVKRDSMNHSDTAT